MSMWPSLSAHDTRALVPYVLVGTAAVLLLRRRLDARDVLLVGAVFYVLYTRFAEERAVVHDNKNREEETVRAAVPTTLPAKSARALAGHDELKPPLVELQRRFGNNQVLREALGFLARFVDYYTQFIDGRRFELGQLQQVEWTMRHALNTLLSLDLQIPDPRPYRRGVLHARKRPTWLRRAVNRIENVLRTMFAQIFDASGFSPEHFEVSPCNAWEEQYHDRWKLR